MAQALRAAGVKQGDRCAAFVPNAPESVIAMLATASIGAVWTSCSPDFGAQGVLDRFGQVEPKILFACDGYYYNGKWMDTRDRVASVARKLPSVERVVLFSISGGAPDRSAVPGAVAWEDFIAPHAAGDIDFAQFPFGHPLYILYSSGTTGVPKCIVHSAGGTLLKHLEEQRLQCDIKRDDRVFYFTTCGWMMWNWLMTALASEATLVLYDGSPFAPSPNVLFDYADAAGITFFGTSAKYIDALSNKIWSRGKRITCGRSGRSLRPARRWCRKASITSTGPSKQDVCLSSISGGTDIVGCFVGGNPNGPVWRGEIQGPMLGMSVDVFSEDGKSMHGEKGELVCTRPFPSMPVRSGTTKTAPVTAPPISSGSPTSGAMAISSPGPSMAAWSSTGGRTRP